MLTTPLANRIHRPLRMAVIWGLISIGVAVTLALAAGAVAWLVAAVGSLFNDAAVVWPRDLVRNVGAAAAPFTLASSTWAAAFLSTDRMPAGRALLATALGVVLLVVLARLESPAVLLAAGGLSWSLAIPFERWGRLLARLLPLAAVAAAAHFLLEGAVDGNPLWPWALIVGASLPAAALILWLTDAAWVGLSERHHTKRDERRQQHGTVPADKSLPVLGEEAGSNRNGNHEGQSGSPQIEQ